MIGRIVATLLAVTCVAGCAAHRFRDRPVVWKVAERSIKEPTEREYLAWPYFADGLLMRRLTKAMALPDLEPAHNINALDEVPNSSWFENRIGVRQVSPAEAATAASAAGPPKLPLVVIGGKSGGGNPGFMARDVDGRRFLIKFDNKENPNMQLTASTVVNRIFWTAGYNVPNDVIFTFCRRQLHVGPGARVSDALKRKREMTEADLDVILATSPRLASGCIRAQASEFVAGKPKGGFAAEGTRSDDPNDKVPHQHRRELRGLRVLSAWVNHTDMKEDNTLDVYQERGGKRMLRHYLLDFGEALGSHGAEKGRYEDGYEHIWDWQRQPRALLSFGLWKRPWESEKETPWLALGAFSADNFDPTTWRPAYPFWPFFEMDPADAFWGAKLVLRFDRPILEAIVAKTPLGPAAARYLVKTLLARREKIGRAYLEALTPLDNLTIQEGKLCAVDLGLLYGLADHGLLQRLDRRGKVLAEQTVGARGQVCMPIPAGEDYSVLRLRIVRGKAHKPPLLVHLKGGGTPRILGLIRNQRW
jgi:hypothetical protein